jgi:hypothetical protein
MGKSAVKGKWLRRLPLVRNLFQKRIEAIEKREVEASRPGRAVRELREGIRGRKVKTRYISSSLYFFQDQRGEN